MNSYLTHNEVTALEFGCCSRKNKEKRRKQQARLPRQGLINHPIGARLTNRATSLQPQFNSSDTAKTTLKIRTKTTREDNHKIRRKNLTVQILRRATSGSHTATSRQAAPDTCTTAIALSVTGHVEAHQLPTPLGADSVHRTSGTIIFFLVRTLLSTSSSVSILTTASRFHCPNLSYQQCLNETSLRPAFGYVQAAQLPNASYAQPTRRDSLPDPLSRLARR
jgi:hypothetical protein